jgi:hypothetical protein
MKKKALAALWCASCMIMAGCSRTETEFFIPAPATAFPLEVSASPSDPVPPEPYRKVAGMRADLDQDGIEDDILLEAYADAFRQHVKITVNQETSSIYEYYSGYTIVRLTGITCGSGRGRIVVSLSSDDGRVNTEEPENLIVSYASGGLETVWDEVDSRVKRTVLSGDSRRMAFVAQPNLNIDVIDFQKKEWNTYPLPELSGGIMNTEWISDSRLGLKTHINPSTNAYMVLDAENGEWQEQYYGGGFTRAGDHFYYFETSPHFSDARGKDRIMNERQEVLYESPDRYSIWGDELFFNEAGSRVAFYEMDVDKGDTYLAVAAMNRSGHLKLIKKMKWEMAQGAVRWENDKRFAVVDDNGSSTVIELQV